MRVAAMAVVLVVIDYLDHRADDIEPGDEILIREALPEALQQPLPGKSIFGYFLVSSDSC